MSTGKPKARRVDEVTGPMEAKRTRSGSGSMWTRLTRPRLSASSATKFLTVEELERDSGKPVVAYTHACFFVAFRTMGLTDTIRGHGRLLASLAKPS